MANTLVRIDENESREIETWVKRTKDDDGVTIDAQLLILYRLYLLEQKINEIQEMVKTHW